MKYNNSEELFKALQQAAQYELNQLKINTGKSNITSRQVTNIIINICDIKRIYLNDEKDESSYIIYNYDKQIYELSAEYIESLIDIIYDELNLDLTHKIIANIDLMLKRSKKIPIFNQAPYYLIKFKNGIYNFKSNVFIDNKQNQHEVFNYDYLSTSHYNYIEYSKQSDEMKDCVINMFNAWSNNNEDELKFLLQICASVLDGDGRGSFIILQSPGGDGKSSFNKINTFLASQRNTLYCNLDEMNDHNILNQIDFSTKFIKGDDLVSNFKLTGKSLSNLKSLTSYEYIQVSQKYLSNKKIRTKALILQNTNTNIKFFENSSAINRRMIYKIWPAKNFHNNKVNLNGYKLEDLLKYNHPKHQLFMETIISYIYFKINYFQEFDKPLDTNVLNELMLSQSDSTYQFLEYLEEIEFIQYQPIILLRPLYEYYKDWLKLNNPGTKIPSSRTFIMKFKDNLIKKYNITENHTSNYQRIKFYPLYQFNINQLLTDNDLDESTNYNKSNCYNIYKKNEKTAILINNDITINQELIDEIKQKIINGDSIKTHVKNDIFEVQKAIFILIHEKNNQALLAIIARIEGGYNKLLQLSLSELQHALL